MADTLEIPVESVQDKSHKFLDILGASMPACLVILINVGLLKSAKLLWQISASLLLTIQGTGLMLSSAISKL